MKMTFVKAKLKYWYFLIEDVAFFPLLLIFQFVLSFKQIWLGYRFTRNAIREGYSGEQIIQMFNEMTKKFPGVKE